MLHSIGRVACIRSTRRFNPRCRRDASQAVAVRKLWPQLEGGPDVPRGTAAFNRLRVGILIMPLLCQEPAYKPSGQSESRKDLAWLQTVQIVWDLRARACPPHDFPYGGNPVTRRKWTRQPRCESRKKRSNGRQDALSLQTFSADLSDMPSTSERCFLQCIFAESNAYSADAYPHVSRLQDICDKSNAHAPQPALALGSLPPELPNLPPSGLNTPAATYSGSTPSTSSAKTLAMAFLSYPAIYGHDNDLPTASVIHMDEYEDTILLVLNNYTAARRAHRRENSRDSHNRFETVKASIRALAVEYRRWEEPRAKVAADYAFALMSALSVH
ncbi:hypothetical protein DFP72DRAFT_843306 [Ephemerocybe angulata]|uniref:Uncharacterized protein n=1 Tax=Ephemerocybe angulata TaxID=980116 RepID=A0A8H6MDV1_9AGAR|nr:hypothetical protein DFP72DRAFT_843306 [Tulosesus angulatus]